MEKQFDVMNNTIFETKDRIITLDVKARAQT